MAREEEERRSEEESGGDAREWVTIRTKPSHFIICLTHKLVYVYSHMMYKIKS